jgi:hypothetical protein
VAVRNLNLLETIIVTDHGAMSIDDKEKEVVSDCLIVLKENAKYGHKTKISELQQALSRITPVPDKEYELTDLMKKELDDLSPAKNKARCCHSTAFSYSPRSKRHDAIRYAEWLSIGSPRLLA